MSMRTLINRFTKSNTKNQLAMSYINNDTYPTQDSNYIGKLVLLKYMDYRDHSLNTRFNIKLKSFTGINSGYPCYFLVLRWDKTTPFNVILAGYDGTIIVTNVDEIKSLYFPPDYVSLFTKINSNKLTPFSDRSELIFNIASTQDEFYEKYNTEHVFNYPVQNRDLIGRSVLTEYYTDIMDGSINSSTYTLQQDVNTIVENQEALLNRDWNRYSIYDKNTLISGPIYRNNHNEDFIDSGRRIAKKGIVIRADADENGRIVVAEDMNGTYSRFVLDTECFIYTNDIATGSIKDIKCVVKEILNNTLFINNNEIK